MLDLNAIYHHEIHFCASFSNLIRTEYGLIFYNKDNPESHDSNHAHILNFEYPVEDAITDIIQFYQGKRIKPRLYTSFREEEAALLLPSLEALGFHIDHHQVTFMAHTAKPSLVSLAEDVSFQRVNHLSQDIIDLIHSDLEGDWMIKALQIRLKEAQYHLLGVYRKEQCLAIASVEFLKGYSRVDDVRTHTSFRGQGLGTRLIHNLIEYHASLSDNILYLYTENPTAIRMYQRVGFQEFPIERDTWTAYLP